MMRLGLHLLVCLCASAPVLSSPTHPWLDSSSSLAVLSGRFEQTKTVAGFDRPLVSQGRFVAVRGQGLLWQTHAPFAGELVITAAEIVHRSGGQILQRLRTDEDRVAKGVAEVLLSLFSGDAAGVERRFAIETETTAAGWSARLEPRAVAMRQVVARIFLRGTGNHIEHVRIENRDAGSTELRFFALEEHGSAAPADLAAFE